MSIIGLQAYRLVPIPQLDTDAQMAIRDIRNQKSVREAMFSAGIISVNEHLAWINSLRRDSHKLAFALMSSSHQPLGFIGLSHWERLHRTAAWGYYVSEETRGAGLATAMACRFLDFTFDVLGLEKLNAEVIEANQLSLKHHRKLGFEEEGFRRSNVSKQDMRLGVYMFGMTKADWNQKRSEVRSQHQHVLEKITVTVDWEPQNSSLSPIDRIEEARARNNLNWMNILRIALERSPATAKQIVSEIRKIDQEISGLTREVIGDE